MNQRTEIICPFCNAEVWNDIYEFTDAGDMEGSFHLECEECERTFEVVFSFLPFIKEYQL